MTNKERNDYFYVYALIEYIARETKIIAKILLRKLVKKASENFCMMRK